MQLSATDLLQGAVFAAEQASRLLYDALALDHQGRYSSAMALAVFSREEVGRASILLDCRKQALSSGSVSEHKVKRACDDHVGKLRRGQLTNMMALTPEQSKLLKEIPTFPETDKDREFFEQLQRISQARQKRKPHDTHQRRLRALYVELVAETGKWNRPCTLSQEECKSILFDVANDYGSLWCILRLGKLSTAISLLPDRPELPPPEWPE